MNFYGESEPFVPIESPAILSGRRSTLDSSARDVDIQRANIIEKSRLAVARLMYKFPKKFTQLQRPQKQAVYSDHRYAFKDFGIDTKCARKLDQPKILMKKDSDNPQHYSSFSPSERSRKLYS